MCRGDEESWLLISLSLGVGVAVPVTTAQQHPDVSPSTGFAMQLRSPQLVEYQELAPLDDADQDLVPAHPMSAVLLLATAGLEQVPLQAILLQATD
jgi:hypothetical protein